MHVCSHMYVCMYVCMHVCMFVSMYVKIFISSMFCNMVDNKKVCKNTSYMYTSKICISRKQSVSFINSYILCCIMLLCVCARMCTYLGLVLGYIYIPLWA